MLYVSGTNEISGTVSYDVSLQFYATVGVKSGGAAIPVTGTLVIENGGDVVNYSSEERARAVKEKMYSVLTKGDSELFPAPKWGRKLSELAVIVAGGIHCWVKAY